MRRFVVAAIGGGRKAVFLTLATILALVGGCSPRPESTVPEDSLTSGRIRVVCAPEARDLIAREIAAFEALYPQSELELVSGTSHEAKAALFADQADLAVITTELAPEERAAAVRGKLALEGYRFARDAIVLVVHEDNPVENVSLDRLRQVYSGEIHDWSDLGGRPGAIEPVVQDPASDVTEFVVREILDGAPIRVRSIPAADDSTVIAEVKAHPRALGFVTLAARTEGVKVLRVAPLTGLTYWKPDLEAVYRDQYPLTRFFSLYVRNDGPKLANGFITYVTSHDGQALVHEQGLVPTAVPVRFVRRSPMVGDH